MKIKVSKASNIQLDWLVAIASGAQQVKTPEAQRWMLHWPSPRFGDQPMWSAWAHNYTTDWSQMGPIIEREEIRLSAEDDGHWWGEVRLYNGGRKAYTTSYDRVVTGRAHTPLIAAARCYVVSRLGEEVEMPGDLV